EEDNNQANSQVMVTETEKGCKQKYIVKNYFYYYLFKFSAALGEEIFYITFLPFTYWNIDHSVSRRMIIVWSSNQEFPNRLEFTCNCDATDIAVHGLETCLLDLMFPSWLEQPKGLSIPPAECSLEHPMDPGQALGKGEKLLCSQHIHKVDVFSGKRCPRWKWQIVMYIGQVSKDILKWPRPLSPPVVKLEMRTNAEYGMPSTHAMAATAISFSFFIATMNQYKYPFELGLVAAFVFSTLVCLSRLYTGMHTVLDVIGGALISAVLLVLLYPAWDTIDHLLLTSPFCPLFSVVVPLVLCYNYPKLDYYSPTRGDTTTILGAAAGATVGFWLNNQDAASAYTGRSVQPGLPPIASTMVFVLARFFVGILVVLLARWVTKSAVLGMLGYRYKFPVGDREARRRLEVEVPYKFVTYSSVGFTATVIVPRLHELLGLM
ncbi:hypothetical protein DV515_00010049, partial [Chloebia gouldiae]